MYNIIMTLLRPQTIQILHMKVSLIHFLRPMTNIFLKLELKQRLKLFQILVLQKALQSPLRREEALKSFLKSFLKSVLHRMNQSAEIIKIFLKQLKRKLRKYTTPTNYLNVLEVLKNMERYERCNSKIKNKIDKTSP